MATPASLFRPNGPTRLDVGNVGNASDGTDDLAIASQPAPPSASTPVIDVIEPPALTDRPGVEGTGVEFDVPVPPSGQLNINSRQSIGPHEAIAGRQVTVRADLRSIHTSADGHVVHTLASRPRPDNPRHLAMRGAHPAGPPPAQPASRRRDGLPVLPEGGAVQIERAVTRHGRVSIAGHTHLVGIAWASRKITLRLDGHLMHAIADNALIGTWPCPLRTDQLAGIPGARTPATPLPPPPLPAGSLRAQRKVHDTGPIMVAGQGIKLGLRHRGKLVTVIIEDTHLRILDGDEEIAVRPRRNLKPITRLHVTGAGVNPTPRQESPDDKTSSLS
jgi:hypothetical protein